MDKIKEIFEKAQTEKANLVYYKENENKFYTTWHATYKVRGEKFPFHLTKDDDFLLFYEGKNLKEDKEKRLVVTELVENIIDAFKNAPTFKIKFLLKQTDIEFVGTEYLIFDRENYEKRQFPEFIIKNKEVIKQKIEKAISLSKSKDENNLTYWVVKEVDEIPLAQFLKEEGYMEKFVSVNNEEYIKLLNAENIDLISFYVEFQKEMKELGYNIYASTEIGEQDYDYYEYDDGSFYDHYLEDEYDTFYK